MIRNHRLMCKHLFTLFVVIDDFYHGMIRPNYKGVRKCQQCETCKDIFFTENFKISPHIMILRLMTNYFKIFVSIAISGLWCTICTIPDNRKNPICKLNESEHCTHLFVLVVFFIITIVRLIDRWYVDMEQYFAYIFNEDPNPSYPKGFLYKYTSEFNEDNRCVRTSRTIKSE